MWLDEVGPVIGAMSKHCLVRKRMTAASEAQLHATSALGTANCFCVGCTLAPVVTSLNVVRVLSVSPPARAAEDLAGCG